MTHILRRNTIIVAAALSVFVVCGGCATTRPIRLADIGAMGCQAEIETYCKAITPGEARILACLYAHEDKLSERCKYTLYEELCRFERAAHE